MPREHKVGVFLRQQILGASTAFDTLFYIYSSIRIVALGQGIIDKIIQSLRIGGVVLIELAIEHIGVGLVLVESRLSKQVIVILEHLRGLIPLFHFLLDKLYRLHRAIHLGEDAYFSIDKLLVIRQVLQASIHICQRLLLVSREEVSIGQGQICLFILRIQAEGLLLHLDGFLYISFLFLLGRLHLKGVEIILFELFILRVDHSDALEQAICLYIIAL